MNIFEAYNSTKRALESAGIEDYVFEAKQIIKHITGFSNSEILMNYTNALTAFQQNNLTAIIKQRQLRYPLQYIFGVLLRQGFLCGSRRACAEGGHRNYSGKMS